MNYLRYVHTTQGTDSVPRFSCGNTLPLTQLPWGMAGFIPQTNAQGKWYYHPHNRSLEGVRLTHQPSPWVGDFGSLLFMPQIHAPETEIGRRWSGFRPKEAVLSPHYMKLRFLRSETTFELAPTERGAALRLNFEADTPFLSIITDVDTLEVRLDSDACRIYGSTDSFSSNLAKKPAGYRMYFVLELENGFDKERTIIDGERALHIALPACETTAFFAISFISEKQAVRNLETELCGKSFDMVRDTAAARWESLLGRVRIDTPDEDMKKTFYSCLYRTFLYPNKLYELDENGNPIHYDSHNNRVNKGIMYTNNGFWDTYRTVYPLYSLIAPDECREIIDGYIQIYDNTGWLPKWPSLVETGIMPGSLIDAVLADAAVKGLLDNTQLQKALTGMIKHATTPAEPPFGRPHLDEYLNYGYIPYDTARESVNCTMDYAYGDFCIARVAECLGETDISEKFDERAKNWRHLFDPKSGFMRGRNRNGDMTEPFDPFSWGGEYTEGSAWQSSFAVYYDIHNLALLHGGRDALVDKLEELFATPPRYRVGGYGAEIHEMTEMAAADFGQCAVSNQPSFHYPWLFAMLGRRDLTDYWVEKIARNAFSWRPDGFPGDEDNGTTAAWYIFAVLGLYPVCPGKAEYISSKPLVDDIYINGKPFKPAATGPYISHKDCVGGQK